MTMRAKPVSSPTGVQALFLAALLTPAGVFAQQPIAPLQFSFSDPGARSMGFGGAFVALADDATAAFANPAGLVQLARPEISVEGRSWGYSTPFTEGGRVEGLPSGNGIDTIAGLRASTSEDNITGLSFVSATYPLDSWSLAFFRHEAANVEFSGETQGLFGDDADCCPPRYLDQRAASDLEIVSYGFSAAYEVSERLSLGLGLVRHDASIVLDASLYVPDDDSIDSLYETNSYLPQRLLFSQRTAASDTDWSVTGGFLWRQSERWSIGGVYRQPPEIDIGIEVRAGPVIDLGVPPGEVFLQGVITLELPDIYGLGFAYRAPDGRITVTFQWDRIEYSNFAESLGLDDQTVDDIDELHLGAEYVFLNSTPIVAVRLGTWWEPDHEPRPTVDDPLLRALLQPGEDQLHYAAGVGVAMQNFQIDLGLDFADRIDTVSLSAIYSF